MERLYRIGGTPPPRDIPHPGAGSGAEAATRLIDAFGRRLTYLRVSVTDRCNLRCAYCLPEGSELPFGDRDFLGPAELELLVGTLVELGIRRVRLTGGEPLVRQDIVEIVERLAALDGIDDLALSTNGTELERLAEPLRRAGLARVNISLDTLDAESFREITGRGNLTRVLAGIEAALAAGLKPVKLNAVLMSDQDPAQLDRLVELVIDRPLSVRFIEMMPTATNQELQAERYLSSDVVKERIEARFGPLRPVSDRVRTGPAKSFELPGARGTIGFITPMSHTFCHDCNRLRLTSRGELRLCLFADRVFPLRPLLEAPDPPAALREAILGILAQKPAEHMLLAGDYGNLASFMQIGG